MFSGAGGNQTGESLYMKCCKAKSKSCQNAIVLYKGFVSYTHSEMVLYKGRGSECKGCQPVTRGGR